MGLRAWWRNRRAGGAVRDDAAGGSRRAAGTGGEAAGWRAAADTAAFEVGRAADEATVMVGAGPRAGAPPGTATQALEAAGGPASGAGRRADEATVMVGTGPRAEPPLGPATQVLPRAPGAPSAAGAASGLAPTRAETALHLARPRVAGVLVVVEGEFEGRAFPLFEGTNRIGREHVCEICLPTERLAPLHVCIECRGGSFRIERIAEPELRVNREPIESGLLRDGDAIQLGMTTFRFRSIVGA